MLSEAGGSGAHKTATGRRMKGSSKTKLTICAVNVPMRSFEVDEFRKQLAWTYYGSIIAEGSELH
jgi:hypothetical protein